MNLLYRCFVYSTLLMARAFLRAPFPHFVVDFFFPPFLLFFFFFTHHSFETLRSYVQSGVKTLSIHFDGGKHG